MSYIKTALTTLAFGLGLLFSLQTSSPQIAYAVESYDGFAFTYVERGSNRGADEEDSAAEFVLGYFKNGGNDPTIVYTLEGEEEVNGVSYVRFNMDNQRCGNGVICEGEEYEGSVRSEIFALISWGNVNDTSKPIIGFECLMTEGKTPTDCIDNREEYAQNIERNSNSSSRDNFIREVNEPDGDDATPVGRTEASEETEGTTQTCEDRGEGLGWALCPGVKAIGSTLEFLDGIIASLLYTDESQFNTDGALYEGWKIIRNIAFFVLIPIGLVMILGTSLGFEVFSAYTIKKAFPRLLFAILFITFSWQLTGFAVEVTNSIGRGMDGIVTSPVRNSFAQGSPCRSEITLPCYFDAGTSGIGAVLDGILSGVGTAVGFVGFLVFLYFYAGTLAVAFAIGMFVLLARQIALTAAILLAPLAILSWIFPGNDGLWKSWWNLFSKLLLMYPLIILLISSGKLFAWIVGL